MKFKKSMMHLLAVAILLMIVTGCSGPAKTETASAEPESSEAAVAIAGLPGDFPKEAMALMLADTAVKEVNKGSDGKTFTVMFETGMTMEDAHTFYAEKMKDFGEFTDTKNEFGYVFQGNKGDYAYTIALAQVQDGKISGVFTVY